MSDGGGGTGPVIGLDFDNTIAAYDDLFLRVALDRGLVTAGAPPGKSQLRDALRRQPDGERAWQRLQAEVYGPRLGQARPVAGVHEFLDACRRRRVAVYVVSHKTEFAEQDETRTNLRLAALAWLRDQGLLADGTALRREGLFFESTRAAKVERIRALGCTHFVDDLPEVFLEPGFPEGVERILLAADGRPAPPGVRAARCWGDVAGAVFGG